MKASKTMLAYLLVALMACCMIPGTAFSDGPWDISNGGGEVNGGSDLVYNRNAVTNGSGFASGDDETGGDGPSLVTAITYHWLYQVGLVSLAESILIGEFEGRSQKTRATSKTSKTRR